MILKLSDDLNSVPLFTMKKWDNSRDSIIYVFYDIYSSLSVNSI